MPPPTREEAWAAVERLGSTCDFNAVQTLRLFLINEDRPSRRRNVTGEEDLLKAEAEDLRKEVAALKADNAAKDAAVEAYFYEYGAEHGDGCPEDDTCDCPLVVAINHAFADNRPGAALLERMRKLEEALLAALALIGESPARTEIERLLEEK
jgi:hypothetical protein